MVRRGYLTYVYDEKTDAMYLKITPKGESDSYDGTFSLTITKGDKIGEIRSGSW